MKIPKLRFKEFSNDWEENKTVIKIVSGNTYPLDAYSKEGTLLVQGLNIYPNELQLENPIYISDDYLTGKDVFVNKEDILVGLNRPIIGKKFKACLFLEDRAVLYQRAGILDFDKSKLSNRFLFQYLFTPTFIKQLLVELVGSDQPYIKSDLFRVTKNIFPSKPEQQKIASFLSTVDTKIDQLSRKKELLEQYKKGVMQKIFSQELRFKADDGSEFPEWEEKILKDVATKKSSNISANKIEENFGDYIIYGASGVLKKVNFFEESEDYISIVKDGAGVGRILYCKGKSSVLGTMDIIKPELGVHTYFLYCLLENIDFTKYVTGSTIPHIYFKDYSNEKCKIPSYNEQTKIANFLSAIDTKIDLVVKQLDEAKNFKKGLLQQMFV